MFGQTVNLKSFSRYFMKKTFEELLKELLGNWKLQVQEMTDEELLEDRSHWMKNFGIPNTDYSDESPFDEDIQTITIELEQLRRFGEIIYKDSKTDKIRKRLKWKHKTVLSHGLLKTFEWYEENKGYFKKIGKENYKRLGLKL